MPNKPATVKKTTKKGTPKPVNKSTQVINFISEHRVRLSIYFTVTIIFVAFVAWRRMELFPDTNLSKAIGLAVIYGLVLFAVLVSNIFIGIYIRKSAPREKPKPK